MPRPLNLESPWAEAIGRKEVDAIESFQARLLIVERDCLATGLTPHAKAIENIVAASEAGWQIVTIYNDLGRNTVDVIVDARQLLRVLNCVGAAYVCCDPEGFYCWNVRQTPGFQVVINAFSLGYEQESPPFDFLLPELGMIRASVHHVQPDRVLLVGTDPEVARRAQVAFVDGNDWKN
jgi:hypothetical protein